MPSKKKIDSRGISQATMLIQDIVDGILETGKPPYPDSVFVDEKFRFFEPKKKDRLLGDCPLWFPKGCFVGIFTSEKPYQFCSVDSLLDFLKGFDVSDPYEIKDLAREKFVGCPIGIVGGYESRAIISNSVYLIFWKDEKTRIYYSPYEKKVVEIEAKVIII